MTGVVLMEFLVIFNTLVLILAGSLITYNLSKKHFPDNSGKKQDK